MILVLEKQGVEWVVKHECVDQNEAIREVKAFIKATKGNYNNVRMAKIIEFGAEIDFKVNVTIR